MPWSRLAAALAAAAAACPSLAPAAGPIDRALAVQTALADAKDRLRGNDPAAAVAVLEEHLTSADGNRAYLDALRSAYAAEVKKLQMRNGDPARIADLRAKLAKLGATADGPPAGPPAADPPAPAARPGLVDQAAALFNQGAADPGNFDLAGRLFAAAVAARSDLTADQTAAWVYCRLKVAADRLNKAAADPAVAAEVAAEVDQAVALVPGHPGLRQFADAILARARPAAGPTAPPPAPPSPAADGWQVVETDSFRIRHRGAGPRADRLAKAAEAKRHELFARWSGPAGGPWGPKCEVTVHPDAAAFAAATGQPAAATGRAVVTLDGGRVTARAVDLRADDPTADADALPRELTYVVLADLFPHRAPPRWAADGMAVLAASPPEVDRYLRTADAWRARRALPPADALMAADGPPADRVTGYYVGAASLVDFLVRWKGDKAFTTFLRDAERYGRDGAVRRTYGVDARQLDAVWAGGGAVARGQAD